MNAEFDFEELLCNSEMFHAGIARCVGALGREAAIRVLARVLHEASPIPGGTFLAGEVLGRLGGDDVVELLIRATESDPQTSLIPDRVQAALAGLAVMKTAA